MTLIGRLMKKAFSRLANGDSASTSNGHTSFDFSNARVTLGNEIEFTTEEFIATRTNVADKQFALYGPMLTRRLLEQISLAIIARLDPIRIIVITKGAASTDFDFGKQNESSFSWTKDVLPKFDGDGDVWSQQKLKQGIVRGLLDGHLSAYLFSQRAFDRVTDELANYYSGAAELPAWVTQIQRFQNAKDFVGDLRRRCRESYSKLSKGIHIEFFPSGVVAHSRAELDAAMSDGLYAVCSIALVSNACDITHGKISLTHAVEDFDAIAKLFG